MLSESASSGDRLAALRDLRDLLARQIDECDSMRDLAALATRFQSVLAEVEQLTPKEGSGDPVDEIAARRAARRSGTAKAASKSKRTG